MVRRQTFSTVCCAFSSAFWTSTICFGPLLAPDIFSVSFVSAGSFFPFGSVSFSETPFSFASKLPFSALSGSVSSCASVSLEDSDVWVPDSVPSFDCGCVSGAACVSEADCACVSAAVCGCVSAAVCACVSAAVCGCVSAAVCACVSAAVCGCVSAAVSGAGFTCVSSGA